MTVIHIVKSMSKQDELPAVANPHISMSQSSAIPFLLLIFVSFFFLSLKVLTLKFANSGLNQGN